MGNKTTPMFSALNSYKNKSFYDNHSTIQLSLEGKDESTWEIFAVCIVETETAEEINKHYMLSFTDDEEMNKYIEGLRSASLYDIDFDGEIGQILQLSTCSKPGQHSKERIVIYAAKIR